MNMNRLSIVLVIAFISYSLGAPEDIESHSADINHDLEHNSNQELEKQNGYGDGNVNSDPSATENPIDDFRGKKGRKAVGSKGGRRLGTREGICTGLCAIACVSGLETSECAICLSGCLHQNY